MASTVQEDVNQRFNTTNLSHLDALRIAQNINTKGEAQRTAGGGLPLDAFDLLSLPAISTDSARDIDAPDISSHLANLSGWLKSHANVEAADAGNKQSLEKAADFVEQARKDLKKTQASYNFVREELPKITGDLITLAKSEDLYSRVPGRFGPESSQDELLAAIDNSLDKLRHAQGLNWSLAPGLRNKFEADINGAVRSLEEARITFSDATARASYDSTLNFGSSSGELELARFNTVNPDEPFAKFKQLGLVRNDATLAELLAVGRTAIERKWDELRVTIGPAARARNPEVAQMFATWKDNYEALTISPAALHSYMRAEQIKYNQKTAQDASVVQQENVRKFNEIEANAFISRGVDGAAHLHYRRLGLEPKASRAEVKEREKYLKDFLAQPDVIQAVGEDRVKKVSRVISWSALVLTSTPKIFQPIKNLVQDFKSHFEKIADDSTENKPGFLGRIGQMLGLHRESTWQVLGSIGSIALAVAVAGTLVWTGGGILAMAFGAAGSGPGVMLLTALKGAGVAKFWVMGAAFMATSVAGIALLPLTKSTYSGTVRFASERMIKLYRNETNAPLELLHQEFTEPERVYKFLKIYRENLANLLKVTDHKNPRKQYERLFELHEKLLLAELAGAYRFRINALRATNNPAYNDEIMQLEAQRVVGGQLAKNGGKQQLLDQFSEEIKKFKLITTLSPADRAAGLKDEDLMRQLEAAMRAEQSAARRWGQWSNDPDPKGRDGLVLAMKNEAEQVIRQAKEGVTRDPLVQIFQRRHRVLHYMLEQATPDKQQR